MSDKLKYDYDDDYNWYPDFPLSDVSLSKNKKSKKIEKINKENEKISSNS